MDHPMDQIAEARRVKRNPAPEKAPRDVVRTSITLPYDAYGRLLAELHIRRMSVHQISEFITELIYDNCKGFISRGRTQASVSGRANPDGETLTMGETLTSPPAPIEGEPTGAGEQPGDVAPTAHPSRRRPRQTAA